MVLSLTAVCKAMQWDPGVSLEYLSYGREVLRLDCFLHASLPMFPCLPSSFSSHTDCGDHTLLPVLLKWGFYLS